MDHLGPEAGVSLRLDLAPVVQSPMRGGGGGEMHHDSGRVKHHPLPGVKHHLDLPPACAEGRLVLLLELGGRDLIIRNPSALRIVTMEPGTSPNVQLSSGPVGGHLHSPVNEGVISCPVYRYRLTP